MTLQELKDKLKEKKFMRPVVYVWKWIRRWKNYIDGSLFLSGLIDAKKENELILIFREGIGDTLYGMSMSEGILQHFPDKKIIVIANIKRRHILNTYPKHERIIFRLRSYDDKHFKTRALHFMLSPGLPEKGVAHDVIDCLPGHYRSLRFNDGAKFTGTIFQLRKNIFHLPDNTPITYHGFKKGNVTSIPDFMKNKHRIAIINPYSNSARCTMSLYEAMCDELLKRGLIVFCNVTGKQEIVRGSIPLRCSIEELYSIACSIPLVVSVRSGILDFIMPSGVSMFVIYDETGDEETLKRLRSKKFKSAGIEIVFGDKYKLKAENRLDGWKSKCKIREVLVEDPNDITPVLDSFDSFLRELKAEGKIS